MVNLMVVSYNHTLGVIHLVDITFVSNLDPFIVNMVVNYIAFNLLTIAKLGIRRMHHLLQGFALNLDHITYLKN